MLHATVFRDSSEAVTAVLDVSAATFRVVILGGEPPNEQRCSCGSRDPRGCVHICFVRAVRMVVREIDPAIMHSPKLQDLWVRPTSKR